MNRRDYDLELASIVQGLTQAEESVNGIIELLESTTLRSPDTLPLFIRDQFVNTGFDDAVYAANEALDAISQAFDQVREMDDEVDKVHGTQSDYDAMVRSSVDNWENDRRWMSESAQNTDEVRQMDDFVAGYKR